VLEFYWPEADSYTDICKTDFKKYEGTIEIITGGFPCQPFSLAGKRKGTEDERFLWKEMLRAVQEIKPKYVIAENVLGLTSIDGGLVLETVWSDLENEGYEVQSFIIPAAGKNAPHRRDRVWIVAHSIGIRFNTGWTEQPLSGCRSNGVERTSANDNSIIRGKGRSIEFKQQSRHRKGNENCNPETDGITSNTNHARTDFKMRSDRNGSKENFREQFPQSESGSGSSDGTIANTTNDRNRKQQRTNRRRQNRLFVNDGKVGNVTKPDKIRLSESVEIRKLGWERSHFESERNTWDTFPSQPPVCGGNDGLPTELDGITFSKWRQESIKGYGNAIVPQVAFEIFKVIQEMENNSI
jgi:DNA (cytosine-5)-methyltransferase 1